MFVTTKNGVYYAVLSGGVKEDGSKLRMWKRLKSSTEEEAKVEAKLTYGTNGSDAKPPLPRIRLRAWLTQLLNVKLTELEYATYEGYEAYTRRYIVPELGHAFLDELTTWNLRLFESHLTTTLHSRGGLLGWKTRLEIMLWLKLALSNAVGAYGVSDAWQSIKVKQGVRKKVTPLTDIQGQLLLAETKGTWIYPAVLLGLMAGLRLGEVRALRWGDIDFDAATVRIDKAMKRTPGTDIAGPPKSIKGVRTLDLNGWVIDDLREISADIGAQLPNVSARNVLVGPLSGKPMESGQFYKQYRAIAVRLGVSTRYHDLRHTHASQLLRAGVSIKVISERLGHSSEAFTLATYIHLVPGEARDAIRKLDPLYPHLDADTA